MHPQDYIVKLAYVTRIAAKVELISTSEYARTNAPNIKELAAMFDYFAEFGYFGRADWTTGKKLYPKIKSWEEYLRYEAEESL